MINYIWGGMLIIGLLVGAFNGRLDACTQAAFAGAQSAVEVAIGLIGIMTFWLGIMKIAEASGLIRVLSRLVQPLTRFLFPSIPDGHPAMGAIIMNVCANVLGLGNAATPMGLLAMQELQRINERSRDTASDAMCTFLALNTACITLVPTTILAIRMKYGSAAPTEIVGTTLFATICGTIVAITLDRIFRRLYRRQGR